MHRIPHQPGASAATIVQMVGSIGAAEATGQPVAVREIIGPWELGDMCVKRRDSAGNAVGLVSYILAYGDADAPLVAAVAGLRAAGCVLFGDAAPDEQAVYVQRRMQIRRASHEAAGN